LTPGPQRVVDLPFGHLDPRDKALLAEVTTASFDWLLERGAINPVP
jgi:hypothetical protein